MGRSRRRWAYVTIEGSPYFVRSISEKGGGILLRLSGGSEEPLAPETLCQGPDGRIYCRIMQRRLLAEFDSHAAVALGEYIDEERGAYQLRYGGGCYGIPQVANPHGEGDADRSVLGSARE